MRTTIQATTTFNANCGTQNGFVAVQATWLAVPVARHLAMRHAMRGLKRDVRMSKDRSSCPSDSDIRPSGRIDRNWAAAVASRGYAVAA